MIKKLFAFSVLCREGGENEQSGHNSMSGIIRPLVQEERKGHMSPTGLLFFTTPPFKTHERFKRVKTN
jgi:hypothetical protein